MLSEYQVTMKSKETMSILLRIRVEGYLIDIYLYSVSSSQYKRFQAYNKMGNNHDKYFGSDKRKIIILGYEAAGKTTFLNYLISKKVDFKTQKTKNLTIDDVTIGDLQVTLFDMGGGERQRVFWKQQYQGTQGIIFVIDASAPEEQRQKCLAQLQKVAKHFSFDIPIVVGLTKVDQMQSIFWGKYKLDLNRRLPQILKNCKSSRAFEIDYRNKQSITQLMSWLLKQTKPI